MPLDYYENTMVSVHMLVKFQTAYISIDNPNVMLCNYSDNKINDILFLYKIKKRNVVDNELYYANLVGANRYPV